MRARDFQILAQDLVQRTGPAELRSAISRAYYAAYHVGVEILGRANIRIPQGPSGHGKLHNYLHNSNDPDIEQVATELNDLRSRRNNADYDLDRRDVENQKTAITLVTQAAGVIDTLTRCCVGRRGQEIFAAIERYRKITG